MAMTTCKECKAQISTTATSCPSCGAKPKKTSGCAILVLGFFGLVFFSAIVGQCSSSRTPSSSLSQSSAPTTPAPPPDPAVVAAEAKKAVYEIEERYKENAKHLKKFYATPDQVKLATADLIKLAVAKGLYEESKSKEEKALSKRADTLITQVMQQQRELYASSLEEVFIKSGMDIKVAAVGNGKSQLRMKYVLISQPLIYKFQNEFKLDEQARMYGFKKIIYTNGFDSSLGETWTVDLSASP